MIEPSSTTSPPAPRLREDIVLRCQRDGAAATWVVKDPVADRFFRFRSVEGFILGQLDGNSTPESIRERVKAEFGAQLSPEMLARFFDMLEGCGLLHNHNGTPAPPKRDRGTVLHYRLKALNPNRVLSWLHARLAFLFTPAFVILSAIAIVFAFCITLSNSDEISLALPQLYTARSLALAWVVALGIIVLHEFAHGLTCKHFGGQVKEMGVLLLFFQPALYCDVSDAWLFPRKSARLWVTFAGAYFEMFLWAVATVVWRITDPSTAINYAAFVVVVTSAIKTLFNLNPLIKLDGYYLLSDVLGIPNLRQRAFSYLGAWKRRLLCECFTVPKVMPRERRIFLLYGLSAWIYSAWLLGWIFLYFGGILTRKFQGWGFVLFATAVALLLQRPIKKWLRRPGDGATVISGMARWGKWGIRVLVLTGVSAALVFVRTDLRVAGEVTVLPLRNADVRAEVEGVIHRIHVVQGAYVNEGDCIATLYDRDLRAELRKSKAELEEKHARLNLLKAGARPEELELLRALSAKAEERVNFARSNLLMDQTLLTDRLIAVRLYQDTKEQFALRQREVQEAAARLSLALAGSPKEEIEAVEAEMTRLRSQQHYVEEQLQLLAVRSPIAGTVITPKIEETAGRAVRKGDLVAVVQEVDDLTTEIAVPEKEIGEVRNGQKVTFKVRAYPHLVFQGAVESIAPVVTATEEPRRPRTVLVTTRLNNAKHLLKPGMTGHAKIHCGERRLWDVVTRRLVRYVRVEFWSWW